MSDNILELKHITKLYPGVVALNDVSLEVRRGEILALVGENGAGKSTLIKTCSGAITPTQGEIVINGKSFTGMTPQTSEQNGIGVIYQEFNLVGDLSVAENIFLGNEDQFTKCGIKNTAAMNKKAQEYLDSYGFNYIDATKVIDDYNFEDRKLVEIVKSTYFNPKVLVVDETTTALGQKGREELFKVMHKVRDTGNCVIFISHDLEEVIEQSDNISVLRDGVKIGSITKEEATPDRLKALMVGREIGDSYYRTDYGEKVSDEVVLSAKNVTVKGQIENLNLDLHKGEILGFSGLMGAGRTETARALFGADPIDSGDIYINGKKVTIKSPQDAVKCGIGYLSEDRKRYGIVVQKSVAENTTMATLEKFMSGPFIDKKKENKIAQEYVEQLATKTPGTDQLVVNLSGGNQQKDGRQAENHIEYAQQTFVGVVQGEFP